MSVAIPNLLVVTLVLFPVGGVCLTFTSPHYAYPLYHHNIYAVYLKVVNELKLLNIKHSKHLKQHWRSPRPITAAWAHADGSTPQLR